MAPTPEEIFETLVKDETDLEGMVAYGLYALQEAEWTEQFKADHNGQSPSKQDLQGFTASFTNIALDRLRTNAGNTMYEFADRFMAANIEEAQQRAVVNSILGEVKRQNSFWKNAVASATGSFLFAVILILLATVLFFGLTPQEMVNLFLEPQSPPAIPGQ